MAARNYSNTAGPTSLTAPIGAGDTVITVAEDISGYPPPPFTLALERGTASEEFCLCTSLSTSLKQFTVQRGYDGTSAKSHSAGAALEHAVGSLDYQEANDHINTVADPHPDYLTEGRHASLVHTFDMIGPSAIRQAALDEDQLGWYLYSFYTFKAAAEHTTGGDRVQGNFPIHDPAGWVATEGDTLFTVPQSGLYLIYVAVDRFFISNGQVATIEMRASASSDVALLRANSYKADGSQKVGASATSVRNLAAGNTYEVVLNVYPTTVTNFSARNLTWGAVWLNIENASP